MKLTFDILYRSTARSSAVRRFVLKRSYASRRWEAVPDRDDGQYHGEHPGRQTREPLTPPPRARERPRRRALPRAARRGAARAHCAALAGALQPRVPSRLRRDAASVPPDSPAGARGGAAAQHRPVGCRHLLHRRVAERRIVHDELRPGLRALPDGVPGELPGGGHSCPDPDLRASGLGAPAVQQVSRRQPRAAWLA